MTTFGGGNKRDVMLRAARRLKTVKDDIKQSYKMGRRERIFENRVLKPLWLTEASRILGRSYDSAHLIRHSLYPGNRGRDLSVVFKRGRNTPKRLRERRDCCRERGCRRPGRR